VKAVRTSLQKVWIVRHGETAWSLSGQHTGRTDIPLTEHGEQQAAALKARLSGQEFARVLTSPLIRARRTCELAGFGDVAEVNEDLMEWDHGTYEGRRTAEIRAERPGWGLFEDGCPGGENLQDVTTRAERVIALVREVKGDVALFAHRDILRVLAARWVLLDPLEARRLYLDAASVSVLSFDHGPNEPIIKSLNT
jgi:broad specificity phosphatase PhoE